MESTTTTFVGRRGEIAMLEAALRDTLAGQGRMVLLGGEPGIGKTRIAQEFVANAQEKGARILWGWCYEGEGAPPYWPWVQPMRDCIALLGPEELRAQMGLGAGVIPEIRRILPDLDSPPELEPEQARFRLFDSITNFFKSASQKQPLILVLDDLHWADQQSLLLLEFLARQLAGSRMLVVGAYRDVEATRGHALSESLARLYQSRSFYTTVLTGLEAADVGPFIQAASGSRASPQLVDAVYAHTEGNPFFMSEVIRLLAEKGELEEASNSAGPVSLGIPRSVLAVVRQRLIRLTAETRQVLSIASVIGRDFDFRLLGVLNGELTEDQLLHAFDEAVAAHLIQESSVAVDGYQFSHAVVQQTLVAELTPSQKARLHARVAQALEGIYGDLPGDNAAELAHHFAQAALVLGPEKMVKYSNLAGDRALAMHAYDDAIEHYQRGLSAKRVDLENVSEVIDSESATLLFGFGKALAATNRRREAATTLGSAFEYFAQEGDVTRAVEIANYPFHRGIGRVRVTPLIARGLELVNPESHDAGRLLSRYGLALSSEFGDHEGAQTAFEQSLTIARREGDEQLETQTLVAASQDDLMGLQLDQGLNRSLQAIQLAQRSGNLVAEAQASMAASGILNCLGNIEESEGYARIALELAETIRDQTLLFAAIFSVNAFDTAPESSRMPEFSGTGAWP